MSDLKSLFNLRTLRAFAKETTIETLKAMAEKLEKVIAEKEEELKALELEQAKQLENINKYAEMLKNDGMSIDDLAQMLADKVIKGRKKVTSRKNTTARPAKYKFTDANGKEKTWTGQGRTPKIIQEALDQGKKLEDFAI